MSASYKSDDSRRSCSNKDGDWICPDADCKNLNFARRNKCNRCGADRPLDSEKCSVPSGKANDPCSSISGKKRAGVEIGKVAAEKSRGLFSAEDWQCSKCANVNWARRHTCNLCNAPRFCEAEERTGYGGGYNDRGVVEYKNRSESDDDYDEFGRRKKKRSKYSNWVAVNKPEYAKPKHMKSHSDQEEDDDGDDDEDDDANLDLSKYDLCGSDSEDNRKPEKRYFRSRSPCSYSRSKSRSNSNSLSPSYQPQ